MKISSLYNSMKKVLPEQHAWWLLEKLTGMSQAKLVTKEEVEISEKQMAQLQEWLDEIVVNSQPIQYILGSVPFGDLEIVVKPPVLIPRPETEEWVNALIKKLQPYKDQQLKILDMCTGSGCIGLALAQAFPNFHIIMSDVAEHALILAQENKQHNVLANCTIVPSDLFEVVSEYAPFDLIVTNPPYIPKEAYKGLEPSVKEWEDRLALEAGNDGLSLIKKIIEQAPVYLSPTLKGQPQLIIEIDHTQGDLVAKLLSDAGFSTVTIEKDFANKDRTALASL